MKEYAIQGYFADQTYFGTWIELSAAGEIQIPYMTEKCKAEEILNTIKSKYVDKQYRIVSREVTPWIVEG